MNFDPADVDRMRREIQRYLAHWRRNPLAFVMECCRAAEFGPPVKWQADLLKRFPTTRKEAVASGHGVGKTRLEAWLLWWFMICKKKPGQALKCPITGPSGGNLEDVIWSEVSLVGNQVHPFFASQFTIQKDQMFYTESDKDWFARLRTSRKENPDALQGFHGDPIFYLLDEGFGIPDEIYHVARGALSSRHSYALLCGNPTKLSGYAYNVFHSRNKVWHTSQVSCLDNLDTEMQGYWWTDVNGKAHWVEVPGRVSPTFPEEVAEESGGKQSAQYYIRVLGEFPRSERDQIIRNEWIEKAFNRELREADPNDLRVMGVDVAWDGEDDSALVVRNGPIIEEVEHWHGNDTTQTANRVEARYNELRQAKKPVRWICVDATGVGAGVYAELRDRKLPVLMVKVAEKPPEDGGAKCRRLRDWLWWKTRLYFKDRRPRFMDKTEEFQRLAHELAQPQYKYGDATAKVEVETKREMKKRKIRSPDLADALCMTFYVDYQANTRQAERKRRLFVKHGNRKPQRLERWKVL